MTALVNGEFTEGMWIVKFADAPGGISCAPVLDAREKSAGGGVIVTVIRGEVDGGKFASPLNNAVMVCVPGPSAVVTRVTVVTPVLTNVLGIVTVPSTFVPSSKVTVPVAP